VNCVYCLHIHALQDHKKDTNMSNDSQNQSDSVSPSSMFGSTPSLSSLTGRRRSDTSKDSSWKPSSSPSFRRRYSQPSTPTPLSTTRTSVTTMRKRLPKKKKHHEQLMESFRDFLEDLPAAERNRKLQKQQQLEDEIGDAMTSLLNANPHFRYVPTSQGVCSPAPANDLTMFQPVISLRNWRRLQALFFYMKTTFVPLHTAIDIPAVGKNLSRYLFWNVRSSVGGLLVALVGLSVLFLGVMATSVVLVGIWALKFSCIVLGLGLSVLIDWNDISKLMPASFGGIVSSVVDLARWIDKILLFGKRYHGREWNQDGFELEHPANTAQSSHRGQYLSKLPPPNTKNSGLDQSTNATYLKARVWGRDTVDHIAAIDFCYLALKEDFVPNPLDKLEKAVFKMFSSDGEDITVVDNVDVGVYPGIQQSRSPHSSIDGVALQKKARQRSFSSDSVQGNLEEPHETLSLRLDDVLVTLDEDVSLDEDKQLTPGSREDSIASCSELVVDMNWMDVGAEIGVKLLGSAAVQKAMTSHDTAEKINTFKDRMESHLAAATKELVSESNDDTELSASLQDNKISRYQEQQPWNLPIQSNALSQPVHAMWTSASAAIVSTGSIDVHDDQNVEHLLSSSDLKPYNDWSSVASNADIVKQNLQSKVICNSPLIPTSSPTKGIREAINRNPSGTKQSIEMIYDGADTKQVIIKSNNCKKSTKRPLLLAGTKIVVPLFPIQPGGAKTSRGKSSRFQMGTVVESKRLCVYKKNQMPRSGSRTTNCLSIAVKLDKCFLRNGEFATLTLRVMDDWGPRYMPRHSKLPLGSCVSSNFGIGVLVGWRVEDDCHIVRCLWQRRGPGSACAYLRRDSIHSTMEAAVGFDVDTSVGRGVVVAYTNGGPDFRCGRYFVSITDEGRHFREILELNRSDILSCEGARFIPIVEHIREAAQYQLQVDFYQELLSDGENDDMDDFDESKFLAKFSKHFVTIWKSFLRAIDEDDEFDEGMNAFIQSCVNFLDQIDGKVPKKASNSHNIDANVLISTTESISVASSSIPVSSRQAPGEKSDSGFWLMDNMFGIFRGGENIQQHKTESINNSECIEVECAPMQHKGSEKTYDRAFSVIRTLMRTLTIAQAASVDEPDFKLGLSVCYEFFLFIKTIIRVQKKSMKPDSLIIWRKAWEEIVSVFGPVKDRLSRIGVGIAGKCSQFIDNYEVDDEELRISDLCLCRENGEARKTSKS
jgi:hypothetical protein